MSLKALLSNAHTKSMPGFHVLDDLKGLFWTILTVAVIFVFLMQMLSLINGSGEASGIDTQQAGSAAGKPTAAAKVRTTSSSQTLFEEKRSGSVDEAPLERPLCDLQCLHNESSARLTTECSVTNAGEAGNTNADESSTRQRITIDRPGPKSLSEMSPDEVLQIVLPPIVNAQLDKIDWAWDTAVDCCANTILTATSFIPFLPRKSKRVGKGGKDPDGKLQSLDQRSSVSTDHATAKGNLKNEKI
ncbi:hypothetical protein BJ742DRAFT_867773 [Cladochytrium replicatum]|nr:hypothetical protein BJ742DRAFT_867773 [Cladochytrium replicatum]